LKALHKTKNKSEKPHRTLFFKAPERDKRNGKECLFSLLLHFENTASRIFCKQKALHRTGTGQKTFFYFFSSFSQASAAPSRYSPP
jgi:hypothetical protein